MLVVSMVYLVTHIHRVVFTCLPQQDREKNMPTAGNFKDFYQLDYWSTFMPMGGIWNSNKAGHVSDFLSPGKVILLVHTYPCQTFATIPIRAYHKNLKA
jgi:hypothetical protein